MLTMHCLNKCDKNFLPVQKFLFQRGLIHTIVNISQINNDWRGKKRTHNCQHINPNAKSQEAGQVCLYVIS